LHNDKDRKSKTTGTSGEETTKDGVSEDMQSCGLSPKDAQIENEWRKKIKRKLANHGSPGKWLLIWQTHTN